MNRSVIVISKPGKKTEVWGSLTEICKVRKWPYHTLKLFKFPFDHEGWKLEKVMFRKVLNKPSLLD